MVIENTADVTFLSGNEICLKDGFHATAGSKFTAAINPNLTGGGDQFTINYGYDDNGDRIYKQLVSTTDNYSTSYIRGPDGQVLAVYDEAANLQCWRLGGFGFKTVEVDAVKSYYYLKDHLGNIRVTVDEAGNVVTKDDYYPFGLQMNGLSYNLANENDRFKYSGKELDNEGGIGLYYFGSRYYDPVVGRWYVTDPARQCSSPYSYAFNSPLMYVDPNGEFIITAMLIGGAINLGIKAYQGKIDNGWDAVAAFGIGAAAGGIGAMTGGAAFAAAGGAAGGIGGFFAGAAGGMAGTAFASPIQAIGNTAYFGDPMMTPKQWAMGVAFGGITGGLINGGIAAYNGRSFWNGNLPSAQGTVPVLNNTVFEPELNTSRRMPSPDHPKVKIMDELDDVTVMKMETIDGIPTGYRSHSAFTRAAGRAGNNRDWHHIIGEFQSNIDKFGHYKIHNINNYIIYQDKYIVKLQVYTIVFVQI